MSLTIQVLKTDDISVYSDLLKQFRTETFKQYLNYLLSLSSPAVVKEVLIEIRKLI